VTSGIGDDVLAGGGGGDTLIAGLGWDTVNGGAGADILGKSINKAGSKISEVIGGTESDVLRIDASKATGKVVIKVNVGAGFTGTIAGKPVIHVKEVERFGLVGGPLADDLRDGPGAARGLFRGFGYIGIVGGPGADFLTGGGGQDWFSYNSISHSGATVASADAILDFRADDQIAFQGLGWWSTNPSDFDGPNLIFGPLTGQKGQLSVTKSGINTILRLDRDGNGAADFMIVVKNFTAFKPANFTYVGAF
jgi:Ca2+-binding RTX toxin-like protein